MACSITVRYKNGNAVLVPDLGPVEVPRAGQTIKVTVGGEVLTVRVTGISRHYLGGDIDNPVNAIHGEEV